MALASSRLDSLDLSERRALFAAFGQVSGASGVDTLEAILRGRRILTRRHSSSTRACAAFALGIVNTPAARLALEKATKDRDPLVRTAAAGALRAEAIAS